MFACCVACPACWQVDTRDILFVVGGAFVHLEKLLMDSRHKSSIGFGNKVRAQQQGAPPPVDQQRALQPVRCDSLTWSCFAWTLQGANQVTVVCVSVLA